MSSQTSSIPTGQLKPSSPWGEYNNILFAIQAVLLEMQTATLVRVVSCTNSGGVSPVGLVDVLPLVNQIDGLGNATPHTTVHNIPYFRIQGGVNAVIIDPAPGDLGICVFASRDISKIKSTKAPANPGSFRQFSHSDGLYIGGVLNGTPVQFIEFSTAGVTITASAITINGDTTINGKLTTTGDTTANGISVDNHVHTDPQGGDTGKPVS